MTLEARLNRIIAEQKLSKREFAKRLVCRDFGFIQFILCIVPLCSFKCCRVYLGINIAARGSVFI